MEGDAPIDAVYDTVHRGADVDLVDLARLHGPVLRGHYFDKCRLRGPAVLATINSVSFMNLAPPVARNAWANAGGIVERRYRFRVLVRS